MRFFIAIILFFPTVAIHATVLGFYTCVGQDVLDSSGAGHNGSTFGTGPTYVSQTPAPVTGAWCMYSPSGWSTNGVTLPAAVIPSGTTGSIGMDFYLSELSTDTTTRLLFDTVSTFGRLGIEVQAESAHMQGDAQMGLNITYPPNGERDANKAANWHNGRWNRAVLTWSGTSVKLLFKDITQGVYTTVYSATMGTAYAPGVTTLVFLGKYGIGTGNDFKGYINSILITDQYTPNGDDALLPLTPFVQWLVDGWGASMAQGYCGVSNMNGLRAPLQALASKNGYNLFFTGTGVFNVDSTIPDPYTDALAGYNSSQFAARFFSASPPYGSSQYQTPTGQTEYSYVSDYWLNDVTAAIPLSYSSAVEYAFLTNTASRGISRVIFDTPVQTVRFTTPGIYETPEVAAYRVCTGVAAIYSNCLCHDTWHSQTTTSDCGDAGGTHPSTNSYGAWANALFPLIVGTVTPTPSANNDIRRRR